MAAKTYSLCKEANKKLSQHFDVREFRCKDGSDKVIVDDKLVTVLEKIRQHFNAPVLITSAYRNATYNKKVGGVSNSQHVKGTAADIVVQGHTPTEVCQYAEHLMPTYGGIGQYSTFTHIDVRSNRSRWQNFGEEIIVDGFKGYVEPKKELITANDIIWELMNGKHKVEILDAKRAVEQLEEAKKQESSLYWILRKLVNG